MSTEMKAKVKGFGQSGPMVEWMGAEVERFNRQIIGYPIPEAPTLLSPERQKFRTDHIVEELREFQVACQGGQLPEAVDAIIDLVYVALGALVEMGVCVRPQFAEVHRANMEKERGTKPSRPDNQGGYDAVKPEGWQAPDHSWLVLTTPRAHARIKERALAEIRDDDVEDLPARRGSYIGLRADGNIEKDLRIGEKRVAIDGLTIGDLSTVLLEVTKVRVSKGNDYNATVPLPEYFPFGHASYGQMLWTKVLRIRNLIAIGRKGGKPNHESLRDSVLDLINYSTYYAEAMDRGDKYLTEG